MRSKNFAPVRIKSAFHSMIVTPIQIKAAENAAFAKGQSAEGLMEIAGLGIAECIRQFFPKPGTVIIFCGKGHNAGDALVAARQLSAWGWSVLIRLATSVEDLAPLTRKHLHVLPDDLFLEGLPEKISGRLVLIDGLLGLGSVGVPRGTIAERIEEMNHFRRMQGGYSVAVDLPSGLNGLTGEVSDRCVQADLTVTLGFVKTGLLVDAATNVVGRLALVPLPGLSCFEGEVAEVITADRLRALLPIRHFDTHKGTYGRIGILAGSRGTLGAARLCSAAAVHAGGGLVTLYALPDCYDLLATLCIPEVMVKQISSYQEVLDEKHNALAIGPGLGREHDDDILTLIQEVSCPCVVDADALNVLSTDLSILLQCAAPRLLTPHPGEMERLFPQKQRNRRQWAEDFVAEYPVSLLLKGARTIITGQGESTDFNTTGNPGMGSGGMGDVLTGVCAALIGSGHAVRDAAMLVAWICGRAAEIAIFKGNESQESLSASSVIECLGAATESLRTGDY
jgi:NAD(P)H-hydrate epimerase